MRIVNVKLLILGLCLMTSVLFGQKMVLTKKTGKPAVKPHPYTHLLSQQATKTPITKDANYERLLVILVDFSLETTDDPNTTGNGKFLLEPDPDYLFSIGSPPHNREYFEANLEAMKYYYRAVSAESYQLQYEVYPKNKAAYTLPHPMGYYMPPNASSELFVARMEEYFKASFELADHDDPEIDFGSYGHYMIIHAGSDWQHDVIGDTPSDIPSFYIKVGSGKEAVVDNGNTLISNACNVPSTISQDFISRTEGTGADAVLVHYGYGALNAVIAHEFGHSLGLVDLYNVYNYRPAVGSFDIMDSGGSGLLVAAVGESDNELIVVEGLLPTMPGPYSRNLLFEQFYRQQGYYKDFSETELYTTLPIKAVSAMQQDGGIMPHTYRIPLNDKEYILVENRSVDPDGDGGVALYVTLNDRVMLYPTYPEQSAPDTPTYEYDYLLPSFVRANGEAIGGGILVWHINEAVIDVEGITYADGWVSNFDNNSINTNPSQLGVSIIEADGLNDLGNLYSSYWTGTPYEYFHAKKPVLDTSGSFVNWSQTDWKPELHSSSDPSLKDSYGMASMYGLFGMSRPNATMSFSIGSTLFSSLQKIPVQSPNSITAGLVNTSLYGINIPVVTSGQLNLISLDNGNWQDIVGDLGFGHPKPDFPPQITDCNSDGYLELAMVHGSSLQLVDFADILPTSHGISFPDPITSTPLPVGNVLYVSTDQFVYQIQNFEVSNFHPASSIKHMAAWDNKLLIIGMDYARLLNTPSLQAAIEFALPEAFGAYEPVVYQNQNDAAIVYIYLMADSGNIYRIADNKLELIFTNRSIGTPGKLAISRLGQVSPVIFFGIGKDFYAIKADGSSVKGFPIPSPYAVSNMESPMSMNLQQRDILFYPIDGKGYIAVDSRAKIVPELSLGWNRATKDDFLFYHDTSNTLYWYYPDGNGYLYIHAITGLQENPILYAGYRNGGAGCYVGTFSDEAVSNDELVAYIYPNPVKRPYFKLRLDNATGESQLRIYDISGALMSKHSISASNLISRDVELDSSKLSSGVYILTLDNNGKQKRLKFAVEK